MNPPPSKGLARSNTTYQKSFQKPFAPSRADVFIAVMGMTGAGKSTFISHCTEEEVAISDAGALESCTQEVRVHKVGRLSRYANVYLVDTPGFDDTNRKDTDILKEIANWLGETYQNKIKLRGILYLHRISDNRMTGCARKNLIMFKNLCGPEAIKNVLFVTTFWEKIDEQVGDTREATLRDTDDFWGFFCKRGAKLARHHNNVDSALAVIARFVPGLTDKPPEEIKLAIQSELVDSGKSLDETSAGQGLRSEFQKEREALLQEMRDSTQMWKEAMESRDAEMMEFVKEDRKRQAQELKQRDQQLEDLKTNLGKMHQEKLRSLEAQLQQQKQNHEIQKQAMERMERERREEQTRIENERREEKMRYEQERREEKNRYEQEQRQQRMRHESEKQQLENMLDGLKRQISETSIKGNARTGSRSPYRVPESRYSSDTRGKYANPSNSMPRMPRESRPATSSQSSFQSNGSSASNSKPRRSFLDKLGLSSSSNNSSSYNNNNNYSTPNNSYSSSNTNYNSNGTSNSKASNDPDCQICDKGLSSYSNCLVCGKYFSDRNDLFDHIEKAGHAVDPKTHARERYVRPAQSKQRSYTRPSTPPRQYVRQTPTKQQNRNNVNPYLTCLACKESFYTRDSLFNHLEVTGHARDLKTNRPETLRR